MVLNIDRDQTRFKQIVRGAIRKNLKKYISQGEFIGKKGKDYVSIPVPQVDIPTFRYDPRDVGRPRSSSTERCWRDADEDLALWDPHADLPRPPG